MCRLWSQHSLGSPGEMALKAHQNHELQGYDTRKLVQEAETSFHMQKA